MEDIDINGTIGSLEDLARFNDLKDEPSQTVQQTVHNIDLLIREYKRLYATMSKHINLSQKWKMFYVCLNVPLIIVSLGISVLTTANAANIPDDFKYMSLAASYIGSILHGLLAFFEPLARSQQHITIAQKIQTILIEIDGFTIKNNKTEQEYNSLVTKIQETQKELIKDYSNAIYEADPVIDSQPADIELTSVQV